jgi:hypothetical protein
MYSITTKKKELQLLNDVIVEKVAEFQKLQSEVLKYENLETLLTDAVKDANVSRKRIMNLYQQANGMQLSLFKEVLCDYEFAVASIAEYESKLRSL